MRSFFVILLAAPLCAQSISIGGKIGVPFADPMGRYGESRPYGIGPTVEVRLPAGFAIEASALYRRLGRTDSYNYGPDGTSSITNRARGNATVPRDRVVAADGRLASSGLDDDDEYRRLSGSRSLRGRHPVRNECRRHCDGRRPGESRANVAPARGAVHALGQPPDQRISRPEERCWSVPRHPLLICSPSLKTAGAMDRRLHFC